MRIPIALAIGLLLTALAIAIAASRSPLVVIRASSTKIEEGLVSPRTDTTICQGAEQLPAGTSAIRFPLSSPYGPSIKVEAHAGGALLTSGSRGSEWVGPTAISVKPVAHSVSNATICFKVGAVTEGLALSGGKANPAHGLTVNGKTIPARTRIEYLRPGPKTFASFASSIAKHMGLDNFSGGSWIVVPLILLMLLVIAITSISLIEDLR